MIYQQNNFKKKKKMKMKMIKKNKIKINNKMFLKI